MKINVTYDNDLLDCDLICIPDRLGGQIEILAQDYLDWLPPDDLDYDWMIINGKKVLSKNTTGFVRWLNQFYCDSDERAYIIQQNTQRDPAIMGIDF